MAERERPSNTGGGECQSVAVGKRPAQTIYALCCSIARGAGGVSDPTGTADMAGAANPSHTAQCVMFATSPRVSYLQSIPIPYRLNLESIFHPGDLLIPSHLE